MITSKYIATRALFGQTVPATVSPFFEPAPYPYYQDQQFGNDQVAGRPTEIVFEAELETVSIGVIIMDAPVNEQFTVEAGSEMNLASKKIVAEFLDSNGIVIGTHTPFEANQNLVGAYYKKNGEVNFQFDSYLKGVSKPIKSIRITAPQNYSVVYFYNSSVKYFPQEVQEDAPAPVVVQPNVTTVTRPVTSTSPATTSFSYALNVRINVNLVNISVLENLLEEASNQLDEIYDAFIDDERFSKLLLNFGSDYQELIINQKLSVEPNKLLVKLFEPLESFVEEGQPVFISREVAKTSIEKVRIELPPLRNTNPYLRPRIKYGVC